MGPALLLALATGLAASSSAASPAPASPAARPMAVGITLRCVASVRASDMNQAKAIVTRIYGMAGVPIVWHGCSDDERQTAEERVAPGGSSTSALEVLVVILPASMSAQMDASDDKMGLAPGAPTERGRLAYVFYDRVELYARVNFVSSGQVLGNAIAHEVGHLLLPYHAHSGSGIMRASWTLEDFQALGRGWLLFTPKQAELLRARLRQ